MFKHRNKPVKQLVAELVELHTNYPPSQKKFESIAEAKEHEKMVGAYHSAMTGYVKPIQKKIGVTHKKVRIGDWYVKCSAYNVEVYTLEDDLILEVTKYSLSW